MRRFWILALVLCVAPGVSLAAQKVYVWTDESGNTEYRDTPPPPHARNVEQRQIGVSTIQTGELPFSVRQAVQNFPVTLWVFDCGAACNEARAHLLRRGVPHTEKDPQANREEFQKATGGLEVPVLFVGTTRLKGYLESEWDTTLDAAGYPRTPPPGFKPPERPAPAAKAAAPGEAESGAGGAQAAGQPAAQ
jgi:hypothetical protein